MRPLRPFLVLLPLLVLAPASALEREDLFGTWIHVSDSSERVEIHFGADGTMEMRLEADEGTENVRLQALGSWRLEGDTLHGRWTSGKYASSSLGVQDLEYDTLLEPIPLMIRPGPPKVLEVSECRPQDCEVSTYRYAGAGRLFTIQPVIGSGIRRLAAQGARRRHPASSAVTVPYRGRLLDLLGRPAALR